MSREAIGHLIRASFILLAGAFLGADLQAQSCNVRQTLGGASSVNLVAAVPAVGTSLSNTNGRENDGLDGSYYQLSTFAGPASVTVATALVSDSTADNDHAPYGLTFINGGAVDVTVTQVEITSDRAKTGLFRTSPKPTNIDPLAGAWTVVDLWTARWTGSITVPAKSCQAFVADVYVSNVRANIPDVNVGGTITTSIGTFTATPFPSDLFVPNASRKVATAIVAFVDAGRFPSTTSNATYGPPQNLVGGLPSTIAVRVKEWSNNQSIAAGMQLTVTIPPQWSNVSIAAAPAPWNAGSAVIVQPTAGTAGSVTISTSSVIGKGASTGDLRIALTPPVVFTKSTFQMKASLNGNDTSTPAHPIRSVCDGGGTILPQTGGGGGTPLNVEFYSPRLNAGASAAPVGQIDFRTDFNVVNGLGTEQITVQAYNFTTGTWTTFAPTPVVPGSSDFTLASTFSGTSLFDYVDDQSRMRFRFVSSTATPHTLRVDYISWIAQTYWVVDNSTGSDSYPAGTRLPGTVKYPFLTIGHAVGLLNPSEEVRVLVGNSQSGTPYDHDAVVTVSGAAGCPTALRGVPDASGRLPLIAGANPAADAGISVAANHVLVNSFEVQNALVGLYAETGSSDITFAESFIKVPDYGYGVLLNAISGSAARGNRVDAAGPSAFFGVWDYYGNGNVIEGNRIAGFSGGGEALPVMFSASPKVRGNIVRGSYIGVHLAHCTGTADFYNNSVDSNTYLGVYSEDMNGTVTSRNNILTGNGVGWGWDGLGTVSSNYDDAFGNVSNYSYHGTVAPGANSLSVAPQFIQTSNPALPTYYRLGAGSPCIDAGTNVGLPFNGAAPDIGAVEN